MVLNVSYSVLHFMDIKCVGRILFHEIEEQDDIFGFQENQLLFYVAFKKLSIHKLYMLLV